jgi:hypothetical protein
MFHFNDARNSGADEKINTGKSCRAMASPEEVVLAKCQLTARLPSRLRKLQAAAEITKK